MREGPQPPACVVESCDNPPVNGMVGYCPLHAAHYANGSAITPPIVQPDDPELIERVAKKAAEQEAKEYAERRRVKTWKTLENGSRVPEEYWTDEELEAIEVRAQAEADRLAARFAFPDEPEHAFSSGRGPVPSPDQEDVDQEIRDAARLFKRALKGKFGEPARALARSTAGMLAELKRPSPSSADPLPPSLPPSLPLPPPAGVR